MLGIGLKLLGWGKTLMDWLLALAKAIFDFIMKYPWQAAVIGLTALLVFVMWRADGISNELETTKTEKVAVEKKLKSYVVALDNEKKAHKNTIADHNRAVRSIKEAADATKKRAEAEAARRLKEVKKFERLARDFGSANPSTGTAEERILREEKTNGEFIKEFRRAQ